MLNWETTDQFGNLVVANSSASSSDQLREDLENLCTRVFDRHWGEIITFSIDFEYGEISAPRGDQVSHMVQMPWLTESGLNVEGIEATMREIAPDKEFQVIGPWPM
jgi:hypothetical protein